MFLVRDCLLLILLLCPCRSLAEVLAPECTAWQEPAGSSTVNSVYGEGLLWKISKADTSPSFLFGTIHVSDERVTSLPQEVEKSLNESSVFAMEVVPEPGEIMSFASLMYFNDGRRLSDIVSSELFGRIGELLEAYHLPSEAVQYIKPWSAFLTMSYPVEVGQVLDLQLLQLARNNGAEINGLETLLEQVGLFENMVLEKQLRLLADTTCHYDVMAEDFEAMKSLYLAQDLAGLYNYTQRYARSGDELYNELIDKLLTRRNYSMVEKMQPLLAKGDAFIAVGAMHLAGEEGLLSQLASKGFDISRIY